ncbi:SCO family protein [Flavobacterium sp. K5-23]|uniref:SCO family protein n=1 Tax=Flavobacterium sp. K5-23 TaxID=2746225 RepID=UPI0020107310|nr:SCO family protein [Flavobacterium sp. K5-23]UQD54873.1 SCO family protein [Flavobacterium sp. K5-23]
MYRIVFLIISSALLLSCNNSNKDSINLPYYNEPTFTPVFITDEAEIATKITHKIEDFKFLNQDSVFVSNKNIEGKIHIANFIFTTCGSICPNMTRNLKVVNDSLGNDSQIVFLSYSVTPWIDKPHVLKKYKNEYGIESKNWHFLTGNKSEIYKLARQSYFAEEDIGFSKDGSEFLHTEHFLLIDKNKRIRGIYNGTLLLEMYQLIDDIRTLEQENFD